MSKNKKEKCYRWVKASERLPDKKRLKEYFSINLRFFPAVGKFVKLLGSGDLTFDIDKYGLADLDFKHIEWLEEFDPIQPLQSQISGLKKDMDMALQREKVLIEQNEALQKENAELKEENRKARVLIQTLASQSEIE